MKFIDHLSKEDIRKFNQLKRAAAENKKKPKSKQKKKENYSQREWEDIMGKNRDIYTRRNGAVRRK